MLYYEWGISFLLIIDTYENGEKFEKIKGVVYMCIYRNVHVCMEYMIYISIPTLSLYDIYIHQLVTLVDEHFYCDLLDLLVTMWI